ncbi:MAG: hypothetical protein WCQ77_01175 [Planctomycetota bacterium]
MSRKQPLAGPTISLFPFLAVLLCMMGALLVLLVIFSRSAQQGETALESHERQQLEQELELARESLTWRREQLAGVRERTAADLATARVQLAGVEENTRALQDELTRLERTAMALANGATPVDDGTLRGLEERLKSAKESLEKARAEQKKKPPAYAVVPFNGRSGTHRRPLYIECCGDGVFLQPEGIRLSPTDFEGPAGPGNPLASALRAAREHVVAMHGGSNDPAMQPYPLLLVRPSGVMAYYAARESIQSWGSDFGYQLIDEDWTLSFPPPDPTLAQIEKRVIEDSRARLAWLAEVRPVRVAKPPQQYRAAPSRGGVVAEGGPSVLGDQSRWDWKNKPPGTAGGGGDGSGSGTGSGGRPDGGGTAGGTASGSPRGRFVAGSQRAGSGLGGTLAAGNAGEAGDANGTGEAGGSSNGTIVGGRYGGNGSSKFAGGSPGGEALSGGAGGGAPAGSPTPTGDEVAGGGAAAARAGGVAGGTATTGSAAAAANGSTASSAAGGLESGASQSGGGSAGGGSGPAMPGLVQSGGSAGGQAGAAAGSSGSAASAAASLAQSRGKNWASLATQDRPIPLTRPIRLECAVNEFRLFDDSGRRVETRIPLDGDTALAIDPLVQAVHRRVDAWGIAGDRMYWKPQLVLSETADGRSRREDLERLLAESGLDTRSRDVRDQIRPLPPVERTTAAAPTR